MSEINIESIASQVMSYLLENDFCAGKDINLDFPLLSNGVIDSVSMISLLIYLEQRFDISFEVHEITRTNFDTISQIASQVLKKLHAKPFGQQIL